MRLYEPQFHLPFFKFIMTMLKWHIFFLYINIKVAVEKLISLKKELAIAEGKDPNEAVGGGSKKGKKK